MLIDTAALKNPQPGEGASHWAPTREACRTDQRSAHAGRHYTG